ncbi:MAG: hypothetical protein GY821_08815 [Gammaproteobacteria bacterium]|nr:hypothetical protein [Gammaproteobacteria bacterium]
MGSLYSSINAMRDKLTVLRHLIDDYRSKFSLYNNNDDNNDFEIKIKSANNTHHNVKEYTDNWAKVSDINTDLINDFQIKKDKLENGIKTYRKEFERLEEISNKNKDKISEKIIETRNKINEIKQEFPEKYYVKFKEMEDVLEDCTTTIDNHYIDDTKKAALIEACNTSLTNAKNRKNEIILQHERKFTTLVKGMITNVLLHKENRGWNKNKMIAEKESALKDIEKEVDNIVKVEITKNTKSLDKNQKLFNKIVTNSSTAITTKLFNNNDKEKKKEVKTSIATIVKYHTGPCFLSWGNTTSQNYANEYLNSVENNDNKNKPVGLQGIQLVLN